MTQKFMALREKIEHTLSPHICPSGLSLDPLAARRGLIPRGFMFIEKGTKMIETETITAPEADTATAAEGNDPAGAEETEASGSLEESAPDASAEDHGTLVFEIPDGAGEN